MRLLADIKNMRDFGHHLDVARFILPNSLLNALETVILTSPHVMKLGTMQKPIRLPITFSPWMPYITV